MLSQQQILNKEDVRIPGTQPVPFFVMIIHYINASVLSGLESVHCSAH